MINLQFFKTVLKSIIRKPGHGGEVNKILLKICYCQFYPLLSVVGVCWGNYRPSEINQTAVNIFIMARSVILHFGQVSLL